MKKSTTPASVDEYIAGCPKEVRPILQRIREVIQSSAPHAIEGISYRMPVFKQGRVLAYFAAFKRHIGFFPPVRGDARLVKAVAPYAGTKGNLRFPLDKPIPYELIARIVKERLIQVLESASRHGASKKSRRKSRGRIVLVHWHREEAEAMAGELNRHGWETGTGTFQLKDLKAHPPAAVVISLRRLPSHGREVADALWYTKWGRAIPIVFVDGAAPKVAATRARFPNAAFTNWEELPAILRGL